MFMRFLGLIFFAAAFCAAFVAVALTVGVFEEPGVSMDVAAVVSALVTYGIYRTAHRMWRVGGTGESLFPRGQKTRLALDEYEQQVRKFLVHSLDTSNGVYVSNPFEEVKGLPAGDVAFINRKVLEKVYGEVVVSGSISQEQAMRILALASKLSVELSRELRKDMDAFVKIYEIKNGPLPVVDVQDIILKKGEFAHWVAEAKLLEERVFREYKSPSIEDKNDYFYETRRDVFFSQGGLVITSDRVIFSGEKKSFSMPLETIFNSQVKGNVISVSATGQDTRMLSFEQEDTSRLAEAMLNRLVKTRAKALEDA